jgi:haloalkane dehalogenase
MSSPAEPPQFVRTPDERFANLADWPYEPRYTMVGGLRIAHVDVGPPDGPVVLCMHGEPSWGYLYRKMIPILTNAGLRVICPDLVGFGRSDKPVERSAYSYQTHVDWMTGWLVCQDWGGLIGLRLVAAMPERFARVVAANTFLPVSAGGPPTEAFLGWLKFSQEVPTFPTGRIVFGGTERGITDEAIAAYDAPFPDDSYTAGARQFPTLVPITADDPANEPNRRAWEVLERFDKPFLTAFSDRDRITAGNERPLQRRIPGAHGQPHVTLAGGGHFLQEDVGEQLAEVVVDFINRTP